ncbi:hypothetical protein GBA52_011808 [Prunus armeniaca]|nr:hypothetical protein GBA52_011808 [Prunus armeniaca]
MPWNCLYLLPGFPKLWMGSYWMIFSSDWWAFDTHSIRPSDVVIMSSSKVRASSAEEEVEISAQSFLLDDKNDGNVLKSLAGLAISQDGRHWARTEGEHHM